MTVIETAALPARRLEWELAETREIRLETYRVTTMYMPANDVPHANTRCASMSGCAAAQPMTVP